MPDFLYQYFSVTGVANSIVYDAVELESTAEETKYVHSVMVTPTGWAGNRIQAKLDREDIFDMPDYLFSTPESSGSTNTQKSTTQIQEVAVEKSLSPGAKFRVGIQCGATAKDIVGCYKYSLV